MDWTPLDLDPPVQIRWRMWNPPRPNLLTDLDPPTKLSENIILNVLVEIGNTLRSSARESKFLILYMRIANAYTIWPLLRNITCIVIEKNITIIQNRQTAKKIQLKPKTVKPINFTSQLSKPLSIQCKWGTQRFCGYSRSVEAHHCPRLGRRETGTQRG